MCPSEQHLSDGAEVRNDQWPLSVTREADRITDVKVNLWVGKLLLAAWVNPYVGGEMLHCLYFRYEATVCRLKGFEILVFIGCKTNVLPRTTKISGCDENQNKDDL